MKKLGLIVLPLILAACNGGFKTGATFAGEVTGVGEDIAYYYNYKSVNGERVFMGYSYELLQQPKIVFTNPAGSIGATFSEAEVTIYDQAGKVVDLGESVPGTRVLNPYTVSFPARVIPAWACVTSAGAPDPQVDPSSCIPANRTPFTRQVTYPAEGNVVGSPTPITVDKTVGVMTVNIAERLTQIAHSNENHVFNGYMIINFKGKDDNQNPVTLRSKAINLGVHRGPDKEG